MDTMLTYGSYMFDEDNIPGSALQIAVLDILVALIAGIAIFTSVFSIGLDPAVGPGLIFHTLPGVFAEMPGGYIFSILFFIYLTIAALTSSISLSEVVVFFFVDELKWKRHNAAVMISILIFSLGIPSTLSFNLLSNVEIFGLDSFKLTDFIASNTILPPGGLFIAVFVAWLWSYERVIQNLRQGAENFFDYCSRLSSTLKMFLKYLSPVLIFLVCLYSIGLLDKIAGLFN
jgi:NSS family neurotransmitter:Na+ symporter